MPVACMRSNENPSEPQPSWQRRRDQRVPQPFNKPDVRRKPLGGHVLFQTLQRPPIPAHLRAMRCRPLPSTFPIRNHVRFLHGDPKNTPPPLRKKTPGPRACKAVPQKSGFAACPTTTNRMGVTESKACEHDAASLRWQHCQKQLGKSTTCAVVEVKSLLRHTFQRRRPVEFW